MRAPFSSVGPVAKAEKSTAASNKKKDDAIDKLLAQFK